MSEQDVVVVGGVITGQWFDAGDYSIEQLLERVCQELDAWDE